MWILPALLVSSSLASSHLRDQLDAIIPGAADWFHQWGHEQSVLQTMERILDGDESVDWNFVSPHVRPRPPIFSYAILARNPDISLDDFRREVEYLCSRYNIPHNTHSIDRMFHTALIHTSMPREMHETLKNFALEGTEVHAAVNPVIQLLDNPRMVSLIIGPMSQMANPNTITVRLQTKITFWYLFCVKEESAVVHMGDAVVATRETKSAIFEHMLLVVLKWRSSSGRMLF